MLKTLKITSIIAVIAAICGTAALVFMGLKENPKVKAFRDTPGVVDRFKGQVKGQTDEEAKMSPLVAQAKAFALRIDPPPPPKPPAPKPPAPPTEVARTTPPKPVIPTPKVQTTVKSDLLATVVYKSAPEKSLALLATTGGKQEWFRQGEKVGHLEIKEIRDGSVVFTQAGQNPQEKFVPQKTQVKSLLKSELKSEKAVSAAPGYGSASMDIPRPSLGSAEDASSDLGYKEASPSGADSVRVVRPIDRTAPQSRTNVSERIQRVRSMPAQPSPQEQKETIQQTISGIEEIMNRQDESLSEEDRKKESEMWMELLKQLQTENEKLEETVEEKNNPEAEPEDADKPAARDPNESE
jgi:hypothetical protein